MYHCWWTALFADILPPIGVAISMYMCLSIHWYSEGSAELVIWSMPGVVLNYQYKVHVHEWLHLTWGHPRSHSHNILLSGRRRWRYRWSNQYSSVRCNLGENVHCGNACDICPGYLQRSKEIQSTEPSAKRKSDLKWAFDSKSATGTVVYCEVMNTVSHV
jgi:hypothetical protein